MKANIEQELIKLLGPENVCTDSIERLLYSHDMAALPKIVASSYRTIPEAIVRPQSASQVSLLMGFAYENSIPVIPRGKATTMMGGAVPVLGGIVLDLSSLDQVVEINERQKTVRIQTGVTWERLLNYLEKKGFTLHTYPTSAPSATVGGWLCASGAGLGKAGLGIGSPKYGYAAEQVQDLEVVLPNGVVVKSVASSEYQVGNFLGSDGILGVVTEINLKIRPLPQVQIPFTFAFDNLEDLCTLVGKSSGLRPFYVMLEDVNLLKAKVKAGLHVPEVTNLVTIVLEGTASQVKEDEKSLQRMVAASGGRDLGPQVAIEEWSERYYPLRVKKAGPSILGGEIAVPLGQLSTAIERISAMARKKGLTIGMHGTLGAKEVLLMPQVLCDERQTFRYIALLSLVKELNDLSNSLGGHPYGVGLFNSFYADQVHGANFSALVSLKKRLDPKKIMNPGKGIEHRTKFGLSVPKVAYSAAMGCLSLFVRSGQ